MTTNLYNNWVAAESARLRATDRIRKAIDAVKDAKQAEQDAYQAYSETVEPARAALDAWEKSKEEKARA